MCSSVWRGWHGRYVVEAGVLDVRSPIDLARRTPLTRLECTTRLTARAEGRAAEREAPILTAPAGAPSVGLVRTLEGSHDVSDQPESMAGTPLSQLRDHLEQALRLLEDLDEELGRGPGLRGGDPE